MAASAAANGPASSQDSRTATGAPTKTVAAPATTNHRPAAPTPVVPVSTAAGPAPPALRLEARAGRRLHVRPPRRSDTVPPPQPVQVGPAQPASPASIDTKSTDSTSRAGPAGQPSPPRPHRPDLGHDRRQLGGPAGQLVLVAVGVDPGEEQRPQADHRHRHGHRAGDGHEQAAHDRQPSR